MKNKYIKRIKKILNKKQDSIKGNTLLECGHYCTTYGVQIGSKIFCHDCKKEGN